MLALPLSFLRIPLFPRGLLLAILFPDETVTDVVSSGPMAIIDMPALVAHGVVRARAIVQLALHAEAIAKVALLRGVRRGDPAHLRGVSRGPLQTLELAHEEVFHRLKVLHHGRHDPLASPLSASAECELLMGYEGGFGSHLAIRGRVEKVGKVSIPESHRWTFVAPATSTWLILG